MTKLIFMNAVIISFLVHCYFTVVHLLQIYLPWSICQDNPDIFMLRTKTKNYYLGVTQFPELSTLIAFFFLSFHD